MADAPKITGLALLREPFPPHQISKLPKESKKQAEERKAGTGGINCTICHGWHHKSAVHLDYVGHAALTDRLLDTDPAWTWEPVAFGPDGLPMLDAMGGLWIRLTVCGVTRLGYGDAQGKEGPNAVKEAIGDALRNAAMRFGAALDLWHKGDLHTDEDDAPKPRKKVERTANVTADGEVKPVTLEGKLLKDHTNERLVQAAKFYEDKPEQQTRRDAILLELDRRRELVETASA